jgi:hypothetical protein
LAANFLSGKRILDDSLDLSLNLVEKFDPEAGTFLFVK